MSFPQSLNPQDPLIGDVAAGGAAELRSIKQFLADFFGIPVSPNTITAGPMTVSTFGIPNLTAGSTVAADPTAPTGIATKRYVDNATSSINQVTVYTKQNGNFGTTPTQTADLVVPVNAGDVWGVRLSLFVQQAGAGTNVTVNLLGPSGANAFLSAPNDFNNVTPTPTHNLYTLDFIGLVQVGSNAGSIGVSLNTNASFFTMDKYSFMIATRLVSGGP